MFIGSFGNKLSPLMSFSAVEEKRISLFMGEEKEGEMEMNKSKSKSNKEIKEDG